MVEEELDKRNLVRKIDEDLEIVKKIDKFFS